MRASLSVDLVVVGAGIVGLAHAIEAVGHGMSVAIVERDDRPVGASIRNFGHICVTAQSGRALQYAEVARRRWLELSSLAGFKASQTGTVVVARAADEMAVLEELSIRRGDGVDLLDLAGVRARLPRLGDGVVGGAFLAADLRVEPSETVPRLLAWLADEPRVTLQLATNVQSVETRAVHTSRGSLAADRIVVCVNHDVDRLYPEVAAAAGMRRCQLHMLEVEPAQPAAYEPGVLTGTSLLRYSAFADCPSSAALRERIEREHPQLLEAGVNLMFTQRPDGAVTLGDTHHYGTTLDPWRPEALDELLLSEGRQLLGSELAVRTRWRGVYASAPGEYLVATPSDGVRVVSVTAGIGMTTAFGLAGEVVGDLSG